MEGESVDVILDEIRDKIDGPVKPEEPKKTGKEEQTVVITPSVPPHDRLPSDHEIKEDNPGEGN
ncbi:hypothetical protein SDC9_200596 [bioreactor metagenome]|uniref:Uncharacterized protein n=1 Tax=bioreactor metagenome TaxID=1076179 RepID=A0A645J0F9_9ZZZZ